MSPSRIPRPGGAPPSPLGPNADRLRQASPSAPSRSAPPSPTPAPTTSGFKPNPAFIQPRSAGLSPPTMHNARIPQARRRPKPPSEDVDEERRMPATPPSTNGSHIRRAAPNGSPDSGLPRPSRPVGLGSPSSNNGRSCLRQPSVPSLQSERTAIPRPGPDAKSRSRAASAAADTRKQPDTEKAPAMPLLFASSFAESREPSVPPHIRIRLRLIHQLGVVLGIDAQGISSKIDVPGLLARVDAAYDRGHQATLMSKEGTASSTGSVSGLPLPLRPVLEGAAGEKAGMAKVKGDKGMLGMLKRFGRGPKGEERVPMALTSSTGEGPAFGVPLNDAPPGSWCTSLIGGQKHELPLVVFTIVEEIYRRGMSQPGIFRLAGDGTRISHLTKVFNLPPLYGDSLSIASEPIHNLTGLVKRYIRDLPEAILDESLFPAFLAFCAEPEPGALILPLSTRISAAQILLKLLPPLHFSLFIYLLAFLGQLPLFPDNRLNVESISIIFGPAMCASRGKGISGLGSGVGGGRGVEFDAEEVSNLVNQSQSTLAWLLRNWAAISEKVLDPPIEDGEMTEKDERKEGDLKGMIDPRLLSPIDLRNGPCVPAESSPFTRPRSTTTVQRDTPRPAPISTDMPRLTSSKSSDAITSSSDTAHSGAMSSSTSISASPSSGSGIFARAFSSMSIASEAKEDNLTKMPKRSASFTSLHSLVKKGGALMRGEPRSGRTSEDKERRASEETPRVHPQIHTVLGSLHDLLVSKDKQIERDARELALLRHTLLEMDEKLQHSRASTPNLTPSPCTSCSDGVHTPPTPAITITSTTSSNTLALKEREVHDMQAQLTTALAALETARLQSRKQAEKTLELEAKLSRADSEKRLERGKLEVALALEQAKVTGLIEERDLARDRLEKVKTTLFAVA